MCSVWELLETGIGITLQENQHDLSTEAQTDT